MRQLAAILIDGFKFFYASETLDYKAPEQKEPKDYGLVFDHELSESLSIYKDRKGQNILMIYESVPTFDSSDREWDSYRKLFLIPAKGKIQGIYIAGGYHISRILIYEDLRAGDEKTLKMLQDTGTVTVPML